jgi:hypothetical protein
LSNPTKYHTLLPFELAVVCGRNKDPCLVHIKTASRSELPLLLLLLLLMMMMNA